jgi:hypothetical protein
MEISMSHKTRVEDRVPKGTGRNRFGHFEDEIIDKVIRPKLLTAIKDGQPRNKTELLQKFREITGYENCTLHTLSEWMEKCGFQVQRKMTIVAPEPKYDELPEGVRELGSGGPRPSGGPPPLNPQMPNPGGLARPY